MIWIILAGILAILFWYTCMKPMNYWTKLGVKQSKNPWPLFGDSWLTTFRRISWCEFTEYLYNMYPNDRYSGFYQFTLPTLLVRDPELIKQITVKDFDHFVDHRPFADPEAEPLWGHSLFALNGQKWRQMRAILSRSFTSSKMKTMFHVMAEAGEDFVKYLSDKNEELLEVEMKDIFTRYTNDVIATIAFGIKVDSLKEPDNIFYVVGNKITDFSSIRKNLRFLAYYVLPKLCAKLNIGLFDKDESVCFRNIIDETIKSREEQGIVRPDMINLLLNARKDIASQEENSTVENGIATVKESNIGKFKQPKQVTNEDIAAQAVIFYFGGFDTTSTAMCFGSYELALNKDIQDKLRKEIQATHKATNGKLTYEAVMSMKYTDMVISEILRKWSPETALDRLATKQYTIEPVSPDEKPLTLNPGDLLWIPVQGLHYDPAYYPNPSKFDPERFSDENKGSINPYAYLPFGAGPRNCIGARFSLLEMKILLYYLILNFEIIPTAKTEIPLRLNRKSFTHTAENGFWLGLRKLTY